MKMFYVLIMMVSIASAQSITLTNDEQSVLIAEDEVVEIDEVASFQNIGGYTLRWSTVAFSDANFGGKAKNGDEKIFSSPRKVYFRSKKSVWIQVRKAGL